jgi:hypothetical protein
MLSTLWLAVAACVFVACGVVMWRFSSAVYHKAQRREFSQERDLKPLSLKQCRPSKIQMCAFGPYYAHCVEALSSLDKDCVAIVLRWLVEVWRPRLSRQALNRCRRSVRYTDPASEHWLALEDKKVRESYWSHVRDRGFYCRYRELESQFEQCLLRLAAHNHVEAGWLTYRRCLQEPSAALCALTRKYVEEATLWTHAHRQVAMQLMAWEYRCEPAATHEASLRWLTIWSMRANLPFGTELDLLRPDMSREDVRALNRLSVLQKDTALQVQRGAWLKQEMQLQRGGNDADCLT